MPSNLTKHPYLECTGGCPTANEPICGAFRQQDDGEGRADDYCASCGHARECHEPVAGEPHEPEVSDGE